MIRFRNLRNLAFSLSTIAAAGSLAACKNTPPQIIVHAEPGAVHPVGQMVVTGSATLEVTPDCADLIMTLTGDAMRSGGAVDAVNKKEQALVAALEKLGLEESQLKLSTLGIDPVYEWIANRSVMKGYQARITITATTRKFDQIAAMMEAGATAGVTQMSSQFRRSDLDELKKKVREMALVAARDKAHQTATTLGMELGRVSAVNEQSQSYLYSNMYFPRAEAAAQDSAAPPPPVNLGAELQPLTLDVTVTYDLPESA